MDVGVRDLKAHLSSYLDRVRRGEVVVVTDHGVPIVRLEAVVAVLPPNPLRGLVEKGHLTYRHFSIEGLPGPVAMADGEKTSTDFLLEQRR